MALDEHLLIDELIALGDLDDTIQHHHPPVRLTFEDHDILELALNACQFPLYAEALPQPGYSVSFNQQSVVIVVSRSGVTTGGCALCRPLTVIDQVIRPRRCSPRSTEAGSNAALKAGRL